MRSARRGLPTASLFVQLLSFLAIAVVLAQVINLLLLFEAPPPLPDFYRLSEIEQAYHGIRSNLADRRPLVLEVQAKSPGPELESGATPHIQQRLAHDLGIPADRIVIASESGRFADRRVLRILRDRAAREGAPDEPFLVAPFQVGFRQDDGRWYVIGPLKTFGLTAWQQRILIQFVLTIVLMAPLAWVFARRFSAPVRVLADAAERLGRDPGAPPLNVKGSAEVGIAAAAFNEMQARLARYVEDRTAMVASIAHDLRTPLTRLRFRIENVPDDQRAKMESDIDQMEAMVSATLAFVRDASRPGERTPLELSSLLESLCDEMAETGAPVEAEAGEKVVVEGDPMALRRLFGNLLENAVKFGGRARARVFRDAGHALVEIEDDGPGIPDSEVERVFEPFYRREPSRSRQTGGIGLGLAVVRSIARGHGGDVTLLNRAGGGLTARVQLPL